MRLLVTGGRDYRNSGVVYAAMEKVHSDKGPIKVLIYGAASGADSLAGYWAKSRYPEIQRIRCPADFLQYGKAAGPIRNRFMMAEHKPDLVLAFPGGRGTADMVAVAIKANVPVIDVSDLGISLREDPTGDARFF